MHIIQQQFVKTILLNFFWNSRVCSRY